MYIPEFWCGVVATVAFEIAALIGLAVYQSWKKRK